MWHWYKSLGILKRGKHLQFWRTESLVMRWMLLLIGGTAFGLVMLVIALFGLREGQTDPSTVDWALCVLSLVCLVGCAWQLIKLMSGSIVFAKTQPVALDGGIVAVPEISGRYELWLFSRGGFTRYEGRIQVQLDSGQSFTRTFVRRIPVLQSLRPDLSPIVWRLCGSEARKEAATSRVVFCLTPVFPGDCIGLPKKDNVESVTLVLKTH